MTLSILYRGPLASCNYDCAYCPFAKHRSSEEELAADRAGLRRFVDWVTSGAAEALEILFTPWGEALVRRWYREALVELSHAPNVRRVAIQTNLSGKLGWLAEADRATVALWTTFHPTEVPLETFVGRCQELDALGVRYSVGIVGKREHRADADRLRRALPDSVYLWVNAYKSEGAGYYQGDEAAAFTAIDPLFPLNDTQHASLGFACAAGHRAFTVDGVGDVRRCHFIGARLGNLYTDPLEAMLAPRACTNERCGCYIGYVHLERLGLRDVYGDGLMERIPRRWG